jgi:OOP family OmpA-OmpF porin
MGARMKTLLYYFLIFFLYFNSFAQQDAEGCKDPVLFTRFPNFYISHCSENYNELTLRSSPEKTETKEGNLLKITYYYNYDTGERTKSSFQIMKNYENAMLKNDDRIVYKNNSAQDTVLEAIYHLANKESEYWINVGSFAGTAN